MQSRCPSFKKLDKVYLNYPTSYTTKSCLALRIFEGTGPERLSSGATCGKWKLSPKGLPVLSPGGIERLTLLMVIQKIILKTVAGGNWSWFLSWGKSKWDFGSSASQARVEAQELSNRWSSLLPLCHDSNAQQTYSKVFRTVWGHREYPKSRKDVCNLNVWRWHQTSMGWWSSYSMNHEATFQHCMAPTEEKVGAKVGGHTRGNWG